MMNSKKLMDTMVEKSRRCHIPLLLIYGTADSLVDKSGCDELYANWKDGRKSYMLIEQGPHGKLTVLKAQAAIRNWINDDGNKPDDPEYEESTGTLKVETSPRRMSSLPRRSYSVIQAQVKSRGRSEPSAARRTPLTLTRLTSPDPASRPASSRPGAAPAPGTR